MDLNIKELAKEAWFAGMQQGIITDRQDRLDKRTTTETLSTRMSFEEWWVTQKKDNCVKCGMNEIYLKETGLCKECLLEIYDKQL